MRSQRTYVRPNPSLYRPTKRPARAGTTRPERYRVGACKTCPHEDAADEVPLADAAEPTSPLHPTDTKEAFKKLPRADVHAQTSSLLHGVHIPRTGRKLWPRGVRLKRDRAIAADAGPWVFFSPRRRLRKISLLWFDRLPYVARPTNIPATSCVGHSTLTWR